MTNKLLGRGAILRISALALTASLIAMAPVRAADITIPVIVKDSTSGYWQIVFAGACQAGKDLGVKVPQLGAQSEADVNGEITILENAVAGKPAAVVIAPTQGKALGAPIDAAAKSVPVIMIDSGADTTAYTSFLTTNNENGGKVAADGLAESIKAKTGAIKGDVALLTYLPGGASLDARAKGFKEEIAAKYPDLHLVAEKIGDGTTATALNITTDLLTANPNMVGIFASNQQTAEAAGQAIAENKIADKFSLIGFDSSDKMLGFLNDGTIAAVIVQDPFRMGYDGVKSALAASKGEKLEKDIDTGANLVTKANQNDPKIAALLHPKLDCK